MTVLHSVELGHEYSIIDVDGSSELINYVREWCAEQFGPEGSSWFYRNKRFYFKRSRDAMWFELRW